jgi:hypothetical protein
VDFPDQVFLDFPAFQEFLDFLVLAVEVVFLDQEFLAFLELREYPDLAASVVSAASLVLAEYLVSAEYLDSVVREFPGSAVSLVKDSPALVEFQASLDLVGFQALAEFQVLAEPAVFLALVALVLLVLAAFLVLAHLDSQDLAELLDSPALAGFLATAALVFRGSQEHRASLVLVA